MKRSILWLWLGGVILAGAASAQDLVPFVLPWDDGSNGPTSLRDWNPAPAGAAGPIRVGADGHLYAGPQRIRFLGVNLCFGACFPTHAAAEAIAARMAKFGVNCVRFHHMDGRPFPDGIRARGHADTRGLDAEALDRLDYLVAQLKRQGIYSDLNLLVSRPFDAADGLAPEIESVDWKARHVGGFFSAAMLDLQKEYARELLLHTNAYTGRAFAQEPAVAFVEIDNENGLLHAWAAGTLDAMPDALRQPLQQQWNEWLTEKHRNTDRLRKAWDVMDQPLGKESISNQDFAVGLNGWILEQHGGTPGVAEVSPDVPEGLRAAAASGAVIRSVCITVPQAGKEGWHIQWNQRGFAVKADTPYTLGFWAKADADREMHVSVGQAHAPWKYLGFGQPVAVSAEWRYFRFAFLPIAADGWARVNFSNLARSQGRFWLAGISLRAGGAVGLNPGEDLASRTIPCFARNGWSRRTVQAQQDWLRFLRDREGAYWQGWRQYLKRDLGVQAPVIGTVVGCSTPNLMAGLDVVDSHGYWQHPEFPGRPWDQENWKVANRSMVNEAGGVPAALALKRVWGKPFLCTEYNHPAPNTYSSEAPLLLAAVAGLQDWDGIFLFAYSHRRDDWGPRRMTGFFDIDQHPLKMANLIAAAALFRRGDLAPARGEVTAALKPEEEIRLLQQSTAAWRLVDAGSVGIEPEVALLHRVGLMVGDKAAPAAPASPAAAGRRYFRSDTGELIWDTSVTNRGVVTIDTARTKAVVGYSANRSFALGDITLMPGPTRQGWCTLALVLLDGKSLAGPCRALLIATGDAENTGMGWKDGEKSSVGKNWGDAPSRVEIVPATVILPVEALRVTVWPLDEQGQLLQPMRLKVAGRNTVIEIGPPAQTLWYEIVVR